MEPFRRRSRPTGSPTSDQRPAASGGPSDVRRPGPGVAAGVPGRPLPAQGPQRGERVVRDLAGPDEVPQRVEHLAVASRHRTPRRARGRTRRPAAPRCARGSPRGGDRPGGGPSSGGRPAGRASRPGRYSAIRPSSRPRLPRPTQATSPIAPELVEQPRLVAGDPRRQDVALEHRGRDRQAGQLVDDLGEALEAATRGAAARLARRGDAVPRRQEPAERRRVDGLDLAAQPGERPAPEEAEHLRVAPLALDAAGPELAAQERPVGEQPLERVVDDADRQPPAPGRVRRQERAVGPRVAGEQPSSAAVAGARKASGTPTGGATPTPSR